MKSNVTYGAEHREQAKQKPGCLVTFDYDGRAVPGRGRMTMQGVFAVAEVDAMMKFMVGKFTKRGNAGAPKTKPVPKRKPKKVLPYGATPE